MWKSIEPGIKRLTILALIMPLTSIIQLATQGHAATQKAQFHELWKPTGLPRNSRPTPEVYFLMVSCVSTSFIRTCQLPLKLIWTWNYVPSPGPTNSWCSASIFRSTDELRVWGRSRQSGSLRPPIFPSTPFLSRLTIPRRMLSWVEQFSSP